MYEMLKFFLAGEWKGKHAVIGALLFIFTAVLITFLSIDKPAPETYSALFWLTVVFTTLQGIAGSFIRMRRGHFAFWQQLVRPEVFLGARLIISCFLMFLYTGFAWMLFALMLGTPEGGGEKLFLLVALFTGIGVASVFTIGSALAARTDQPGMLLPVLTFPVLIPVLLVGMRTGRQAFEEPDLLSLLPGIGVLFALDVLIVVLGLLLVRSIWKE